MFSTERKVEAYVRLLHSELDTTTVTATLTLLMSEARAASDKQRRLIALERLTQRNSTASLNELQALEKAKTNLSTVLLRETGVDHGNVDDHWGHGGPAGSVTRRALSITATPSQLPVAASAPSRAARRWMVIARTS